ncbi:hypothetical protein D3C85_1904130 [compost metagenome]
MLLMMGVNWRGATKVGLWPREVYSTRLENRREPAKLRDKIWNVLACAGDERDVVI